MKQKGCLLLITIFAAFAIVILLQLPKNDHYDDPYFKRIREGVLGKISFKGKLINYKEIYSDKFEKSYSVWCIRLDYSNTDSFFYFQDENALKIKGGIASVPGGGYIPNNLPYYIKCNMNNNYKDILYYRDGRIDTLPLNYNATGLSKEDLNDCN